MFLTLFSPRCLIYTMGTGTMGGLFPKENMIPSQKLPFPESGWFLHRPPEASVSCPIAEYLCLSPALGISVMPGMKGLI